MLTCNTVRTKDSCLITRFQNLWPRRVTMLWHLCTLSKPHQIQWVWIHFCCSSNSLLLGTDVLKYELCVYLPALFEPAGTMLQSDKPSQANAIQGWIHHSSIQIPQYVCYIYVGGALIKKKSMENWADLWVTVWKVYWVCKKIGPTKVLSVWWLLRWSFYKRQFSSEMEEIIWQSKPHQIQWVWIHFCCSSNSLLLGTDVLKYELCVYLPALFEPAGTMLQSDKPSQANAIQGWIHHSSIQIPQYVCYIYGRIRLPVSTASRTYELSGQTHVTPLRT